MSATAPDARTEWTRCTTSARSARLAVGERTVSDVHGRGRAGASFLTGFATCDTDAWADLEAELRRHHVLSYPAGFLRDCSSKLVWSRVTGSEWRLAPTSTAPAPSGDEPTPEERSSRPKAPPQPHTQHLLVQNAQSSPHPLLRLAHCVTLSESQSGAGRDRRAPGEKTITLQEGHADGRKALRHRRLTGRPRHRSC